MSEPAALDFVEINRDGGASAFADLMGVLAPEPEGAAPDAPAGPDAAAAPAAAPPGDGAPAPDGGTGGAAVPTAGDPPAGAATPPAPVAGDPAAPAAPADAGAAGADGGAAATGDPADPRASWTATAEELTPRLAELATKLEERTASAYQTAALEEVRKEYPKYFAALEQHPRMLVGTKVPALGRDGEETLRDAEDARDWQEAVKHLLAGEVRGRASQAMDENAGFMSTVHASIELFQNNTDLIPGTKDFDVELANRFTTLAEPYELRVDGKLQGYSVPVQPLISQLRAQLVAERSAQAAATPPAAAPPAGAPAPPATVEPPQAGITSKAGAGSEQEDFSALFGTLGLPDFRI